jgi:hypothetical protein
VVDTEYGAVLDKALVVRVRNRRASTKEPLLGLPDVSQGDARTLREDRLARKDLNAAILSSGWQKWDKGE